VFHETGDADVPKIEDQPLNKPGQGEVLIQVVAIGLNRAEVMFRRGNTWSSRSSPSGWAKTRPGWWMHWDRVSRG
jgi:NADPH:quinone reductase-like Zn-dependent oxidoreductase